MQEDAAKTLSNCRLKEMFSDVKQRSTFCRKKTEQAKFNGAMIIRIEPHDQCELVKQYLTLKVPPNLTIAYLNGIVSKRLNLKADSALYLFSNNKILLNSTFIDTLFSINKEEDQILYINYAQVPTF